MSNPYRCELCRDGFVTVFALETRSAAGRNITPDAVTTVACRCPRGDAVNARARDGKARMIEVFSSYDHVLPTNAPWRRYGMTETEWAGHQEEVTGLRDGGATATAILESLLERSKDAPRMTTAEQKARVEELTRQARAPRVMASASYRGGAAEDGL